TYWLNAGTGYPTSVKWELPRGWSAGDIQWPTPGLIRDPHGTVTGNGYEGVLYLPVTLSPPQSLPAGGTVTLKATVAWLMCWDECIPGSETVTLVLPVSAAPPNPNAATRTGLARMPMPVPASGWKVGATHVANTVTLDVAQAGGMRSPHFFS